MNRKTALRDQLHRAFDRNTDPSACPGVLLVVLQHQVFPRMQIGGLLIAVIEIHAGLRERRCHLLQLLLLKLRIAGQILPLPPSFCARTLLVPLVRQAHPTSASAPLMTLPIRKQKMKKTKTNPTRPARNTTMPLTLTSVVS